MGRKGDYGLPVPPAEANNPGFLIGSLTTMKTRTTSMPRHVFLDVHTVALRHAIKGRVVRAQVYSTSSLC